MLGFCALVLSQVCVPPQYAQSMSLRAMYHSQHMDNRNARAQVAEIRTGTAVAIFLSDYLISISSGKLDRSCAGSICVFYRRHCPSELECRYEWAVMDAGKAGASDTVTMAPRSLRLSARSPEEMRDLQRNVTFVMARDEARNVPAGKLSVADLGRESPDTDMTKLIAVPQRILDLRARRATRP